MTAFNLLPVCSLISSWDEPHHHGCIIRKLNDDIIQVGGGQNFVGDD